MIKTGGGGGGPGHGHGPGGGGSDGGHEGGGVYEESAASSLFVVRNSV
ncbi:MAG: hypothetical protein WBW16_03070 [Bacteroidota bacterium]